MDVKWMCGSGPLENGCETDVGIHPSPPHGFDMALGFVLPVRTVTVSCLVWVWGLLTAWKAELPKWAWDCGHGRVCRSNVQEKS